MFLGTPILEGLPKGFGRVLGGPNPRFSNLVRHFFEAKFRMHFGRATNRKKVPKRGGGDFFSGLCGPGGKDYRIGGSLPRHQFQALL